MYPIDKIEEVSTQKLSDIIATEIMNKQVTKISKNFSIEKAILILDSAKVSGAPVVDENNRAIGFISESDLLIQISHRDKSEKITFSQSIFTISENLHLKEIILYMSQNKLKLAPVVTSNREVIGSISRMDLLKFIINFKGRN
ncbi:HPP family protein [Halobacteriovorax sp. HLS]|uniref:CBS domain-containing protein n=1 Tax=Halobacteriovorax sp. HLS TaxID=2234000 RepID=UPI000FDA87AD|nr:CBS domain-containing protein [Halobacteriovorax sp. HLS]